MRLRAVRSRWFEILTLREDLPATLDALARTGAVELETTGQTNLPIELPDMTSDLSEYDALAQHYATYWPTPRIAPSLAREQLSAIVARSLAKIRNWASDADPLIRKLQGLELQKSELAHLKRLVGHAKQPLPSMSQFAAAGPYFRAAIYSLPRQDQPERMPSAILNTYIDTGDGGYLLVAGPALQIDALGEELRRLEARILEIPAWLPKNRVDAARDIAFRISENDDAIASTQQHLFDLNTESGIADAICDITVVQWFVIQAQGMSASENFVHVTGWTDDHNGDALNAALRIGAVRYLLRFPEPPEGINPPIIYRNPNLVRPFEIFARLLGTPSADEADPSPIVAILAPLLFGFMFGDVGQGLVLLIAGLLLGRRFPVLRILITGGTASIAFGVLFGSVFSREDVIPALWFHPLSQPVTLLLVTCLVGAVVLSIGILLDAIQAAWRREIGEWLSTKGGLTVAYFGIIVSPFYRDGLWALAFGICWAAVGHLFRSNEAIATAVGKMLAEVLETLAQLLLNTVSFVRVGAFALAHAGLSAAIVGIADNFESVWNWAIVMLLGNILVILLECVVVGVQITRLLLFEFFIRFLKAGGRAFRPLTPPTQATVALRRSMA